MNDLVWWLLAGAIFCAIAAIVGYRAYARAALKRQAERLAAEDAARLQAQRRAAIQDAARVDAAKRAEAEAARAKAEAQRLVDARRAAEAARAEAARAAAAQAAAKAAAERHAAEEAARARVAAAAAAREAARLAAERAAVPPPPAPVVPAPQPPRIVLTPAPPARKTREQTLVMVADDSKIVRVKTGRLLEQHRYRVSYATDGLDAAQQLQSNTPDVVITDVEMPGLDGFELTRKVRQNPGTAHIPVIMITAAEDRHRDDAQRAGVSMLLGKPYPEDELIAHIKRAMNEDAGA